MVIKYGRYGKFLACPGFPECRNAKPFLQSTGVDCPIEGCNGQIVERKSKRGRSFYGCSNYPECSFVTWDKPVAKKCPQCGALLVEKGNQKKGIYYQCIQEQCGYRETVETES